MSTDSLNKDRDSSIAAAMNAIHEPLRQSPICTPSYRQQQGLTLIEIMIALLIGAFLLGGVMEVFLKSRQTYRVQEALSRLQENGRFAMDFLTRDIRMTDYQGCQGGSLSTPKQPKSLYDTATRSINEALVGVNGAPNANSAKDAPDEIQARWSENGCNDVVTAPCSTDLNQECPKNAAYSISAGNLQTTYLSIEGVENMQILYGDDTNGDGVPNYYVPAGTAGLDMTRVNSVRVSLLLRTIDDNIASQSLDYTYNGATTTATDRRIRRVFTSTIALRNRLH
jgi:type IV pilus assembly protein PilW